MKRAKIIIVSLLLVFTLIFIPLGWWQATRVEKQKFAQSALPNRIQGNSPTVIVPVPASALLHLQPTLDEGKSAVEKVNKMITSYHTRMGENPVGTNAEITQYLMGANPVHATFSSENLILNAKGGLIDPWGTPYFFHQISGDHMEIHSAGPDKIMGTPDDIIEN